LSTSALSYGRISYQETCPRNRWVAHASRVLAMASSPSRTFLKAIQGRYSALPEKIVAAGHRNQHARRARYPIGDAQRLPDLLSKLQSAESKEQDRHYHHHR